MQYLISPIKILKYFIILKVNKKHVSKQLSFKIKILKNVPEFTFHLFPFFFQNVVPHYSTSASSYINCSSLYSIPVPINQISSSHFITSMDSSLFGFLQCPLWRPNLDDVCFWISSLLLLASTHFWKRSASTFPKILLVERFP